MSLSYIYHLANDSWTLFPAGKPGTHHFSICGHAKDSLDRDVIILAGSSGGPDKLTSYLLDVEVFSQGFDTQVQPHQKG